MTELSSLAYISKNFIQGDAPRVEGAEGSYPPMRRSVQRTSSPPMRNRNVEAMQGARRCI